MAWFQQTQIQENILLVTEPEYLEYANIFVIGSKDHCLVMDTGLGFQNLKEFLQKLGYNNFTVTVTHSHFDHAGGLKDFQPKEVILTKKIEQNLQNKKLWGLEYFSLDDFKKINQEIMDFYKNFQIDYKDSSTVKNTIKIPDHTFEIIETAGHTDDSVILYNSKNQTLITGDTFYDGTPYFDLPNSSKNDLIESLKIIQNLDFETVLTGHNQVLTKKEATTIIAKWQKALTEN